MHFHIRTFIFTVILFRDEIFEEGSKISLFLFKEGDMLNLLRVIENEDGSYSPCAAKGEIPTAPVLEKIVENNGMQTNILKLREQMQNLSLRKQMRSSKGTGNDGESSKKSDLFVKESDNGVKVVWDSKCVGQKPIAYKLLNEYNTFPDKNMQVRENNFEAGEIALKEKHRTRSSLSALSQESLRKHSKPKSIYSENKGNDSITKQKYTNLNVTKSQQKVKKEKESGAASSSMQSDVKNSDKKFLEPSLETTANLQFARLMPKSSQDSLELKSDAQQIWEIHDTTERLKESTTCKIGVLKRHQSVDYAFDTKLSVDNSQRDLNCYKNTRDFEVFGGRNYYQLPQFISNPNTIPPNYAPKEERMCDYVVDSRFANGTIHRSPLYGRKPRSSEEKFRRTFECVPKIPQSSSFPSGASNIERLRNDYVENQTEYEEDVANDNFDSVCNLYNISCRSDGAGYNKLCLNSNKSAADTLNPLRLKTGTEESQDLAKEIKRIANLDNEREVQLGNLKLDNLPVISKKHLRCEQCNRRLNISNNYTCRCGRLFCAQHRYSEMHNCSHDYKTEGRIILARQNPLVVAEKLRKI